MIALDWKAVRDRLPSWVVEGISALLFVAGAALAVHFALAYPVLVIFLLATAGGILYEVKYDANGFSWGDVAQRELWIALLALLCYALKLR